jgi:hypothetical protein
MGQRDEALPFFNDRAPQRQTGQRIEAAGLNDLQSQVAFSVSFVTMLSSTMTSTW